jgi:ribosomal protein L32
MSTLNEDKKLGHMSTRHTLCQTCGKSTPGEFFACPVCFSEHVQSLTSQEVIERLESIIGTLNASCRRMHEENERLCSTAAKWIQDADTRLDAASYFINSHAPSSAKDAIQDAKSCLAEMHSALFQLPQSPWTLSESRKYFEEWAVREGYGIEKDMIGNYFNQSTQNKWNDWQADPPEQRMPTQADTPSPK